MTWVEGLELAIRAASGRPPEQGSSTCKVNEALKGSLSRSAFRSVAFADGRFFSDGADLLRHLEMSSPSAEPRAVWEMRIAEGNAFSFFISGTRRLSFLNSH
jgi:hypothetical protein